VTREHVLEYASKTSPPITPKDIFGIAVKTVGLCIVVYGFYTIFYGVAGEIWGLFPTAHGTWVYVIFAAAYILFGLALMRTKWIADFAYGRE
jgi:hypothetical protein